MEIKKKSQTRRNFLLLIFVLLIVIAFFSLPYFSSFDSFDSSFSSSNSITKPSFIGETSEGWSFSISEDEKKEVDVSIVDLGNDIIELTLFEHENSTTSQSYKWDMAICGDGDKTLKYANEDSQGGFDNAYYEEVNYESVVDNGMNETWCDGGDGFILFSSGSKNQFPKKIRLDVSEFTSFKLYAGSGSVQIDASSDTTGTYWEANENICQNSSGDFHVAYEGADDDLWYASSSDGGTSWDSQEILAGTITMAGIVCSPNDELVIYALVGGDIDMWKSTDSGASWGSQTTVEDDADTFNSDISACVDSGNVVHWCGIDDDDDLYYINSDGLDSASRISSADTDHCDIEVDISDNVYIVMTETVTDDIDIMTDSDSWSARNTVHANLGSVSATQGQGVSIAIDSNNRIVIASIHALDLQFCNGTTSSLTSWSCQEIDATNSYVPDIAITEYGDVFIFYADWSGTGSNVLYMNSSNWTDFTQTTISSGMGLPSIADSQYGSANNIGSDLHYVYTSYENGVYYDSLSVTPPPVITLNISDPTTSNALTVSNSSNETIAFDVFSDETPITTGVTIGSVYIDDVKADIIGDASEFYEIILNTANSTQDVVIVDSAIKLGSHSMWSLASIPADVTITNAIWCAELVTDGSALDNDVDVYRFDDQSWTEGSPTGTFDASVDYDTFMDEEFDQTTQGQVSCVNVLDVIKADYDASNSYSTIYFEDPDNIPNIADLIAVSDDNLLAAGDDDTNTLYQFCDREGSGSCSPTPTLNITYTSGSQEFWHNGTHWLVNVTMPNMTDGTYDLFINATYDGTTYNDTETNAITYGEVAENTCSPTSPLTDNYLFECSDNCNASVLNAGLFNVTINGTGFFYALRNITNYSNLWIYGESSSNRCEVYN